MIAKHLRSPAGYLKGADVDIGSVHPTVSWRTDLPCEPVPGAVPDQLCFDWHVEAKPW